MYLLPVKSNSTHYHAGTNLYPNDEDIQILFLVFKPESQHQRLNPSQRGEECFATVESTELQCYKPGCLSLLKINWVGLAYTHLCWGFLATTFLCTSCFPMDLLTVYAFFLLVDNSHALILTTKLPLTSSCCCDDLHYHCAAWVSRSCPNIIILVPQGTSYCKVKTLQ